QGEHQPALLALGSETSRVLVSQQHAKVVPMGSPKGDAAVDLLPAQGRHDIQRAASTGVHGSTLLVLVAMVQRRRMYAFTPRGIVQQSHGCFRARRTNTQLDGCLLDEGLQLLDGAETMAPDPAAPFIQWLVPDGQEVR